MKINSNECVLQWSKNRSCFGKNLQVQLTGTGYFTNDDGEQGFYYNNYVYFFNSGKFGILDLQTGEVQYKPYRMHFLQLEQFEKQFKTQQSGFILWDNGSVYAGHILDIKPISGGSFKNSQKGSGLYCNSFVYFTEIGNFGVLNVDTGYVQVKQYNIHFDDEVMYQLQQNQRCKGNILWSNGCLYYCNIFQNLPYGSGDFCNSEHENGVLDENNVYFYESGRFGTIDLETAEIQYQQRKLFFKQKDFYQLQSYQSCSGIIQWPNGNQFIGYIKREQIYNDVGQFKHYSGEEGLYLDESVYFYKSGRVAKLKSDSGNLDYLYSMHVLIQFCKHFLHKIRQAWINGTKLMGYYPRILDQGKVILNNSILCAVHDQQMNFVLSGKQSRALFVSNINEIDIFQFKIKFQSKTQFLLELQGSKINNAVIKWSKGYQYVGVLKNFRLPINYCRYIEQVYFAKFFDSNGDEGIYCNDHIYIMKNGKIGTLDLYCGLLLFPYSLIFDSKMDYIEQYRNTITYGTIKWPNGNQYQGIIHNNQIFEGELLINNVKRLVYKKQNPNPMCVRDLGMFDKITNDEIKIDMDTGDYVKK